MEKIRRQVLWFGTIGTLVFPVVGYLMIDDRYGINSASVRSGFFSGLILLIALTSVVVSHWHRKFTKQEVAKARKAHAKVNRNLSVAIAFGLILNFMVRYGNLRVIAPFVYSFAFTLMTGACALGSFMAYRRKGILRQ